MSETVVLITGANRGKYNASPHNRREYAFSDLLFLISCLGLGLGLAELYLQQPNTRVILTARSNTSGVIDKLPQKHVGILHGVYKLDNASTVDAIALREALLAPGSGINKIDIVIANAGVGEPFDSVLEAPIEALENFYQINTLGPVRLYQQLWKDLLERSEEPKIALISSVLGSVTHVDSTPCGGYGASKAAANYLFRKIHLENEKIISLILHPG